MSDEETKEVINKICIATVEVKVADAPFLKELMSALADEFQNLPLRVKFAVNNLISGGK